MNILNQASKNRRKKKKISWKYLLVHGVLTVLSIFGIFYYTCWTVHIISRVPLTDSCGRRKGFTVYIDRKLCKNPHVCYIAFLKTGGEIHNDLWNQISSSISCINAICNHFTTLLLCENAKLLRIVSILLHYTNVFPHNFEIWLFATNKI